MTESTNLWELVKKNPYNPHFWTELVIVSEETQNYEAISKAYNGILTTFPLLHTYWYKLAQLQHNKLTARDAAHVFPDAVRPSNLANSVDMWYLYCEFVKKYSAEFQLLEAETVFENALSNIGSDYNSDQIWSLYINMEEEHGEYKKVSQLFARVLSLPIRNIDQFWNSFSKHVESHPIEDCVTPEEHLIIEQQVSEYADKQELASMESINQIRRQYTINLRQEKCQEAQQNIAKILYYELKIQQTYFHFKKPSDLEIANWLQYIDYIDSTASFEETCHLFERCLIPCSLCPFVWFKYAEYVFTKTEDIQKAIDILDRANETALCNDPAYHRLRGIFFENHGMQDQADNAFTTLAKFKGAFAAIESSFYKMRKGEEYIEPLLKFYSTATDANDIAPVAALLNKLNQEINPDELLQRCKYNKLALSVACGIYEAQNNIAKAKEAFKAFIIGKADINDRIETNRYFVTFLNKVGAPIDEIRLAMKQQIMLEKESRVELRRERREEAKNTQDLSENLDRWINYLQEAEAAKQRNDAQ